MDHPSASPSPLHLVVATPCYGGGVSSHFTQSLLVLQRACIDRGIGISVSLLGGDALITRARNILVRRFLDLADATHLMFIDGDIGFPPDQVFALLDADKDVCGGVYPLKRLNWDVIRAFAQDGIDNIQSAALNYVVDFLDTTPPHVDGDFVEVRAIGSGFMLIRREVIERMARHYPDLRYACVQARSNARLETHSAHALFDSMIDPDSRIYLSEDYAFCKRWRDMGGTVWAHMKSRLVHVGTHAFGGDPDFLMSRHTRMARPHAGPAEG